MSEPVPQRIGDAERDRAAEYLREHVSVGRLTQDEFDERVSAALQARTAADLEPLFRDLPAPKPAQEVAPASGPPWPAYSPPPRDTVANPAPAPLPMPNGASANLLGVASAVGWGLWVLFCIAFGWDFWWLVFIPIVISSIAGQQREELKRREKLWERQQRQQLPPGPETSPPAP